MTKHLLLILQNAGEISDEADVDVVAGNSENDDNIPRKRRNCYIKE